MKRIEIGLLPRILLAIALGVGCGFFFPEALTRVFLTFNALFGNFLNFIIPLLIIGLVVPGIADLGNSAGRLLLITAALSYGFTLFSGFFTYGACTLLYPWLLEGDSLSRMEESASVVEPYFTVDMPPLLGVMSALIFSFVLGIGISRLSGSVLKGLFDEFRKVIVLVIERVIIPLLPFYIFGIFLSMTVSGQVAGVLEVFVKLIALIFVLTLVLLLVQFSTAGAVAHRNPLRLLRTMLAAYVTALGTQSSAATIPVTLDRTLRCGVRPSVAGFVVPLCATIHLSGSTMKIVACALAIITLGGLPVDAAAFCGFILMLGITMVAAPGVPGGAIMAAAGLLQSMLGFDEVAVGLMIALYIAMDSFGTATNVTGDGAIAVIVDRIAE
ncbi:dicarboxylate/amino acid:cation symporter [Gallalistipes aquisgranensis]|uniref:dicarboxylate/amino acid:cation symporter n=1 Tax=Gallalistipes aquisgranensis TaxID=2779358 RepID=UPI001CF91D8B|nr:dicarboxylate/amino acid:cation symporter [Gallalistipes aquisgranensis]MBE5033973.1 dicarboxylate/amino acid:cation symporter [Gallalistipes aquisgranensis]